MSNLSGICDKSLAKLNVRRFTFMELREKLFSTNLFEDNIYFKNYINLIISNYNTKKQRCKTQIHHIIPVTICNIYNIKNINSKDNLINLLYKDHVLAHYYLALCVKEPELRYKMVCAINFILGKAKQVKLDIEDLKTFTLNLDEYQRLYEESKLRSSSKRKGLTHDTSEETKRKISLKNKGRVYINKDDIVRSIYPEDLSLYLNNGWTKGNPNNNKNRNLHKGWTTIHKDNIEKRVDKSMLEQYFKEGWAPGISDSHKFKVKTGTQNYYNTLTKEEKIKKCGSRKGTTHEVSLETRLKISQANKGKKRSESQRVKNSINKKGTIHMTNGLMDVMIRPEREQEFLNKGYYRGRSKNKKEYRQMKIKRIEQVKLNKGGDDLLVR